MSHPTQTQRTIDMNDAVQAAVPFGLTRGQIDRAVVYVRGEAPAREIAQAIAPGLYLGTRDSRDEALALAGAVRAAVRDQDQQPGPLSQVLAESVR